MKTPLIILLLISSSAIGQEPWYKITKADIYGASCYGLAGAADGLNESGLHHRFGINNRFWDNRTSWKNKYRDYPTDKRSAYPFSKNLLVWTTDGYHLTRMIKNTSTLAAIVITASDFGRYKKSDIWKVVGKKLFLSIVANRIAFHAVYLTTNNSK